MQRQELTFDLTDIAEITGFPRKDDDRGTTRVPRCRDSDRARSTCGDEYGAAPVEDWAVLLEAALGAWRCTGLSSDACARAAVDAALSRCEARDLLIGLVREYVRKEGARPSWWRWCCDRNRRRNPWWRCCVD